MRRLLKTITITELVWCIVVWMLTACASGPVLPFATSTPIALPSVTPVAWSTLPPTPSAAPALLPTPFPSLAVTRLTPTPWHTPTAPIARTATARSPQTSVLPTVPSEGWDTNTLLARSGKPFRLYALQGDRNALIFGSEKRRLLMSDDLGDTWTPFPGGLPVPPTCLANIDLDYATLDTLYASTCLGLFKWNGDKWTLISSQETRQVAIVYGRPLEIWASVAPQKGPPVLRSDDGGQTWRSASGSLQHFVGLATLAIDPRNAQTVYGIIIPKYAGSYLRRMFVGNSWHTMPTPLSTSQIDIGMTIDGATGDLYVTVYAEEHWQLWRTRNPQVSDEQTVAWEKVSDFPPGLWATVLASGMTTQELALFVRLAPSNCSVSDARCDPFVERSIDGGKTWTRMIIH